MLHRAAAWLRAHAALVTLCACTLVPTVGWTLNTVWPAPVYGYLHEQALLVAIGLGALLTMRYSPVAAIVLYFAGALLPVGAMLEHQQAHGGGWSALELTPLFGILFVALLTRDERATLLYGGIAIVASGMFCGQICNDWGQAGAMAFLSGGLSAGLYGWLGCDTQKIITLQNEIRGRQNRIINQQGELAK